MKREVLVFPLLIFLTNFVSAFSHSGYNRFSITGLFDSVNPQDMFLMILFIILFAFINMATSRIFRDSYGEPNRGIAGVVAFSVSLLMVYGIYRTGFDFENLFYDMGISTGSFYFIIPILFLVAAIFIIWKLGISALILILGLLISLVTLFTDLIYEKRYCFSHRSCLSINRFRALVDKKKAKRNK